MREEYNSVLSTSTEAYINISAKPKYWPIILARPIYRSISTLDPWLLLKPFLGDFHNHHFQKQTFTLSRNLSDILIRMKKTITLIIHIIA